MADLKNYLSFRIDAGQVRRLGTRGAWRSRPGGKLASARESLGDITSKVTAHLLLGVVNQNQVFYNSNNRPEGNAKERQHGKEEHVKNRFRHRFGGGRITKAHPHAPVGRRVQVQNEDKYCQATY